MVPPPDGGQIVFAAYKCIVRRPPNERFKIIVTLVGIIVLIASTPYLVLEEIIEDSFSFAEIYSCKIEK